MDNITAAEKPWKFEEPHAGTVMVLRKRDDIVVEVKEKTKGRARKWSGNWEARPRGVVPPNAGSTLIAQVPFDSGRNLAATEKEESCRHHHWSIQ